MRHALLPGFADPARQAQACFRRLLEATARPGTIVRLDAPAPPPLPPAAAALALTLCDADTPVWLEPRLATGEVRAWLRFHSGCPIVADEAEAGFAFASAALAGPDRLACGSDDYPDRSATLVLEVCALGSGETLILRGPGIEGEARLAVSGLPEWFRPWRERNAALYPRGVDAVLVAADRLAALPRSTVIVAG
ncbi:MAG: phosphonate C-P lyase system protein PhnH [Acetobacteraceae bacterium]